MWHQATTGEKATVKPIMISESVYRDKVAGCWLGKNIGGTLGAPFEGRKEALSLTFYDPLPDKSAPNDDLDLQLVWLRMLQERGVRPTLSDFADYWGKHLAPYPWNEYGFCQRNLGRGLRPPVSGCFENYYVDEMGSPIRSEIWACVAPGDPQLAASMAWNDAVLDHAGGEGVHGEMFWAAVESAAFVIDDPLTLIEIGLEMIPIHSLISRAVREAVWSHRNHASWEDARERVLRAFGHWHPCNAAQNHAFTVMGWLYGGDFGERLCAAVNCGYDTDCTGATLGSVLGILGGASGIPTRWRDPVGDEIVLHRFTRLPEAPKTIDDLADQTVAVARRAVAERSAAVEFGAETRLPEDVVSLLNRNRLALATLRRDVQAATVPAGDGVEITLHYHGAPVIRPGIEKDLSVSVERDGEPVEAPAELLLPVGWAMAAGPAPWGGSGFTVSAAEVADRTTLTAGAVVDGKRYFAEFMILGPGEAQGYPAGANVRVCERCHARIEACICER
jgi:ADP-ribosylglycohydrolase